MTVKITKEHLQKLFPKTRATTLAQYVKPLNDVLTHFGIADTVERVAAFLAQVGHESGEFKTAIENLNYSATGLRNIFPKYFNTDKLAAEYARKPEKIANRVYANRMGNGNEQSGDGWKFRGKGLLQLTGKNNHQQFADDVGMTLDEVNDFLLTPSGAISSAAWFWDQNKLNQYADANDFVKLTKRINGGTIGLQHRQELYNTALQILKVG